MTSTLLIGIDLGTSSVKVEVYSEDGELLASGSAPISRQDPDEWIGALRRAMPVDTPRSCGTCGKIVSVDSTSGSFLLVD
ncbi:MAG: xylulose kinase, partial [Thermoprotei archaeon]